MIRRTLIVLALAVPAGASRGEAPVQVQAGPLTISEPWSRATPGGAKVAAGYLVVENRGAQADRLLGAEAEVADRGEVHESAVEAGVARMTPISGVAIAPNGRVELKPGGYHLMLTGLKRPLRSGERFSAVLLFEKAGRVPVTFSVRALGAGADGHHHH